MPSRRTEGQIDDVLLATSLTTAFLYVRRRARRMFRVVRLGAVVGAGACGLGVAAGAAAWYRSRASSRANPG
jgi:hypothetical protein